MKFLKTLLFLGLVISLTSCEIVQETKFNEDGSGTYSLGFDMSEMMKMGAGAKSDSPKEQIDSLIVFADYLALKKDSIAKLSKEKQEKINALKDFKLHLKMDTISNTFTMKMNYDFKDTEDLAKFGEKLKNQDVKELDFFTNNLKSPKSTEKSDDMPDFNKAYITSFTRNSFSLKMKKEDLEKAKKNKDTTLTKDNPMANMVKFKTRYIFPFKIKSLSNKNARILSDFKGVEITANLFELNNNPEFFNTEIEFEK